MSGGDTAISVHDSFAVDVGRISALPARAAGRRQIDAGGKLVLPGFVDCHTHALYAGDRAAEHAALHAGESYAQIAARGGGIVTTVNAVRAASEADLIDETLPRLHALRREGVSCIEIKSGYGLDHENELKMLRSIGALGRQLPMDIEATYLGAHTVPPARDADEYLDEIIETTLPVVAREKLASAVDIYVEPIAFSVTQMQRLFAAACNHGLACRVHAEQLSYSGATAAAAALGARSADHLEYLDDAGIEAMATHETIAVMLPGAFYFLGETTRPPVEKLRARGVAMAIATDLNPGSSPLCSLLGAAHLAVHLFGLTPSEALRGITWHAARVLGRESDSGHLGTGAWANFSIWALSGPEYLTYQLGGLTPDAVFYRGIEI